MSTDTTTNDTTEAAADGWDAVTEFIKLLDLFAEETGFDLFAEETGFGQFLATLPIHTLPDGGDASSRLGVDEQSEFLSIILADHPDDDVTDLVDDYVALAKEHQDIIQTLSAVLGVFAGYDIEAGDAAFIKDTQDLLTSWEDNTPHACGNPNCHQVS